MSYEESNSEKVQRLLRCKRYEQPPPGYFVTFSDKVLARIEAESEVCSSSWWSAIVKRFDARPVLVCAYSLAMSSLLIMGFKLSESFEAEAAGMIPAGHSWSTASPGSPLLGAPSFEPSDYSAAASVSPTKLVFHEDSSRLYFPGNSVRLQTVGFSP